MRERTWALLVASLLSISALGRSDFKCTQSGQLTSGMAPMEKGSRSPQTVVTTSVKGSYLRIDLPDGSYGIIDLNEHRELQVDPKSRTYSEMTFDEIRARNEAEQREGHAKNRNQPTPEFQKSARAKTSAQVEVALTGRTQILLGQTAHESKIRLVDHPAGSAMHGEQSEPPGIEIESWVAQSVSGFKEVRNFYARLASAIGWTPPDLTVPRGFIDLLAAAEAQGYEQPVWVPLMTKGIVDLSVAAETSNALPMLVTYGLTPTPAQQQQTSAKSNEQPRNVPNGAQLGHSSSAASRSESFVWELAVRVISFSTETLDKLLFEVPSNYVQTQVAPKDMWILGIGQW